MNARARHAWRTLARACSLAACASLAGCAGVQSALDPAGPQANRIDKIWWLFLYVSVAVWVLVMIFLALSIYYGRGRRGKKGTDAPEVEERPDARPDPARERRMTTTVVVATVITTLTLIVLTVASFSIGRALTSDMSNKDAVTIEVTGQQWWWQVRYMDADPSKIFYTANELHIPVGQPVTLKLKSPDVIHSFWVPNLVGKKDLVPGHDATLWFQADKEGVYRGQCAEYCGLQHAHMAFWVIAEPLEKYQAWLAGQRSPAHEPQTDSERRGQQVFLNAPCVMCHTIQGTPAGANIGPNLTHLASRAHIAAATLPNTRGHLSGWVVDPQAIKPGNRMPPNLVKPDDLQALLD
ncbi:MAG TPA: cytochrome c oxidase subunit II, partial [Pyrinomonadaceae bacterium]|nr:cytochrome c oxidase subunit II [Pyrinomonadaceae bacterium]